MSKINDNTDIFQKKLNEDFPEVFYSKKGIFDRERQIELQIKLLKIKNDQMQIEIDKERVTWRKYKTYAIYAFLIVLIIVTIYLAIQIQRLDEANVFIDFLKTIKVSTA